MENEDRPIPHELNKGFYKIRVNDNYSPVFQVEEKTMMWFKKDAEIIEVKEPEGFFSTKELIKHRTDLCNICPKKKLNICTDCGCFIPAKIKINGSTCPDSKW